MERKRSPSTHASKKQRPASKRTARRSQEHQRARAAAAEQLAKQIKFLEAFALGGNVSAAAKAAKIGRRTHYDWVKDEAYTARFDDAQDEAADRLELEARRRAVTGILEPVFYKGVQIATVRTYSDRLLVFLLTGARPDRYARLMVQGSGKNGAIRITLEDLVVGSDQRRR